VLASTPNYKIADRHLVASRDSPLADIRGWLISQSPSLADHCLENVANLMPTWRDKGSWIEAMGNTYEMSGMSTVR